MKHIELIKEFKIGELDDLEKDKEVKELFNSTFRQIVEVQLRNNAVLSRHKADVPITVFCLAGSGIFSAGKDLNEEQGLRVGTFITLEAGIEHEVKADPDLHILVTKFKDS